MRVKVCFKENIFDWTRSITLFQKEWYGWHFTEMAKIISDNIAYAKVILLMNDLCPTSSRIYQASGLLPPFCLKTSR